MKSVPVRNDRDGRVRACEPHRHAVLVDVSAAGRVETHTVYIGETADLGRHDIILRRGGRLVLTLGTEAEEPTPSWHLVDPARDAVLAVVRMSPMASTVPASFIEDHRTFGARS